MRKLSVLFNVLCMASLLVVAGCARDEVDLTGDI